LKYVTLTKLYRFNQDIPNFSAFKHRVAASEQLSRIHWKQWVAAKLSRFEPARLSKYQL